MNAPLTIAGVELHSRLFLGTGKFGSGPLMRDSLAASGTQLVTVALRRVWKDWDGSYDGQVVERTAHEGQAC